MTRPSLPNLIARRKPGHSLEADFYTRPDIFEADMAAIFGRHWIYVGVEPDVPGRRFELEENFRTRFLPSMALP